MVCAMLVQYLHVNPAGCMRQRLSCPLLHQGGQSLWKWRTTPVVNSVQVSNTWAPLGHFHFSDHQKCIFHSAHFSTLHLIHNSAGDGRRAAPTRRVLRRHNGNITWKSRRPWIWPFNVILPFNNYDSIPALQPPSRGDKSVGQGLISSRNATLRPVDPAHGSSTMSLTCHQQPQLILTRGIGVSGGFCI